MLHGRQFCICCLKGRQLSRVCRERRLSCVVTWRGDNCHVLLDGGGHLFAICFYTPVRGDERV